MLYTGRGPGRRKAHSSLSIGHGSPCGRDTASTPPTGPGWRGQLPAVDEAERQQREIARAQLRDDDPRRNASDPSSGLASISRSTLPERTYYLMEGPVGAGREPRDPVSSQWRNPDLFWPDDRRWFVATDVDFWSLNVGGDNDLVAELADNVTTPTEAVTLYVPPQIRGLTGSSPPTRQTAATRNAHESPSDRMA